MQAGKLRHRVTIQTKGTPTRDSHGQEVIVWTTFAQVWGSVEPLRGREFMQASAQEAELTTRIRIRHKDGVLPSMRVLWDGHTYNIRSVQNVYERQIETHLLCTEIVED